MSSEFDRNWDALVARARRAPAPPLPRIDVSAPLAVLGRASPFVGWPRAAAIAALVLANALVVPLWSPAYTELSARVRGLLAPTSGVSRAPRLPAERLPAATLGEQDFGALMQNFSALASGPAPHSEEMSP